MKSWKYGAWVVLSFLWVSCASPDSDGTVAGIAPEDRITIENLEAEATDKDQVLLTWDALEGAKSYKILRKYQSDEIYLIQDEVKTNSYSTLVLEEHYVFRIWAFNALGQVFGESEDVLIDTTAPDAPSNVQAQATSTSTIRLSWDAVSGVLGYKIYRNDGYGYYSLVKEFAGAAGRIWTDSDLKRAYRYQYKITSYGEFEHESADSGVMTLYTYQSANCTSCDYTITYSCPGETCTLQN